MALIEPRTLKGFRDYPPALMIPRERVLQTARGVYRSFGFAPIDTPALEYAEVLLGKGGEESDRLVYRFQDHGDRNVAMRFDLTVPFARFAAQNVPQLGTPFKRYAMGPVWRGENTAAGRYREFWQCDFDTIGTTSNASDIEVVLVINELFLALNIERFTIRVNNRMVLNGLLESLGVLEHSVPLLRSLDKLLKIGREKVIEEMTSGGCVTTEQASQVLILAEATGTNAEKLAHVEAQFGSNKLVAEGVSRLRELLAVASAVNIPESRLQLDLSIARGLDYYTGTIYETFLTDLPTIGSVCSGGRYDNLAGLYTKQVLPGVGASLGVDRLLTAMEELKHPWMSGTSTPAPVLLLQFEASRLPDYAKLASLVRAAGIGVEIYPEAKKLNKQFEYAEKRGFRLALIAGSEELANGQVKVKNLATRTETTVAIADLVGHVQAELG
ncbi:MAG: histidine--tRNA ligase [Fimbriiglobus sp.]